MVCRVHASPPRAGLRLGGTYVPAIPVHLTGDSASLLLAWGIPVGAEARLILRWEDDSVTDLGAELIDLEGDGRIAHVRVHDVQGDWRPFADYLGRRLGETEESEAEAYPLGL